MLYENIKLSLINDKTILESLFSNLSKNNYIRA